MEQLQRRRQERARISDADRERAREWRINQLWVAASAVLGEWLLESRSSDSLEGLHQMLGLSWAERQWVNYGDLVRTHCRETAPAPAAPAQRCSKSMAGLSP